MRLAESMTSVEGQNRIFFGLVNIRRFVRCVDFVAPSFCFS